MTIKTGGPSAQTPAIGLSKEACPRRLAQGGFPKEACPRNLPKRDMDKRKGVHGVFVTHVPFQVGQKNFKTCKREQEEEKNKSAGTQCGVEIIDPLTFRFFVILTKFKGKLVTLSYPNPTKFVASTRHEK